MFHFSTLLICLKNPLQMFSVCHINTQLFLFPQLHQRAQNLQDVKIRSYHLEYNTANIEVKADQLDSLKKFCILSENVIFHQ